MEIVRFCSNKERKLYAFVLLSNPEWFDSPTVPDLFFVFHYFKFISLSRLLRSNEDMHLSVLMLSRQRFIYQLMN